MATPPSCALSNAHILSSHNRPSLETDLVLCDVPIWARTYIPLVNLILEKEISNSNIHDLYTERRGMYSLQYMCTTVTYLYSTELCHVTYWYSIPGGVDEQKSP